MTFSPEAFKQLQPHTTVYFHTSLPSTMTEAARLGETGAPHGTVVVAGEQTAGIGRMGRSWMSQRDMGLYASVLLRLPLPPSTIPLVSLAAGLATADAIESLTSLRCDLRWPNDVLVAGRKIAGVIAQLVNNFVIVGVGINLRQTEFPPDLRTPATSILLAGHHEILAPERLLAVLVDALHSHCRLLTEGRAALLIRAFTEASSFVRNRRVTVEESGLRGTTAGLDDDGFLLLRVDGGTLVRLSSGGIRAEGGFA